MTFSEDLNNFILFSLNSNVNSEQNYDIFQSDSSLIINKIKRLQNLQIVYYCIS